MKSLVDLTGHSAGIVIFPDDAYAEEVNWDGEEWRDCLHDQVEEMEDDDKGQKINNALEYIHNQDIHDIRLMEATEDDLQQSAQKWTLPNGEEVIVFDAWN